MGGGVADALAQGKLTSDFNMTRLTIKSSSPEARYKRGRRRTAPAPVAEAQLPPRRGWLALLVALVVVYAASGLGALASIQAKSFYALLQQPDWAPPAAVFAPVWTTLFTMMGFSAWLVWREPGHRRALVLFGVQLAVNVLWSWLFFAWHQGAMAFVDVVLLECLILATAFRFRTHSRLAALLLLPYAAWVGFAAVLNFWLWQHNPGLLG